MASFPVLPLKAETEHHHNLSNVVAEEDAWEGY
jgi:hypothetical protein